VELIGRGLFGIDFARIKSLSIEDESVILQKGALELPLRPQPDELRTTFLCSLQDVELKSSMSSLVGYILYYNSIVMNVVVLCRELGLRRIEFSLKFDLLRLKNTYPTLDFNQDLINEVVYEHHLIKLWHSLYGSLLIHRLLYQLHHSQPFIATFSEALQHS
jgi:hypothetical protein